jgi:hypothetical protein
LEPGGVRAHMRPNLGSLDLLVAPYDPLTGNEAGFEEFFVDARSSAEAAVGVVMVVAVVLIVAPLSVLLGLFIAAAIIHILVKIFVRPTGTHFYTTP